jgi:hypothetical protein
MESALNIFPQRRGKIPYKALSRALGSLPSVALSSLKENVQEKIFVNVKVN